MQWRVEWTLRNGPLGLSTVSPRSSTERCQSWTQRSKRWFKVQCRPNKKHFLLSHGFLSSAQAEVNLPRLRLQLETHVEIDRVEEVIRGLLCASVTLRNTCISECTFSLLAEWVLNSVWGAAWP
mmetsp:Transcript_41920/g.111014  ORF Transcript_41920/g.111014 Transcript_41920/m.111014 type:complete len:124 (+) Transcript_41920:752-1123(+)